MASLGNIFVVLGLKADQFKKGMSQAGQKIGLFGKRLGKSQSGLKKFTSGLSSLSPVALGLTGVVVGLGAAVADAFRTMSNFEQAMADVSAITGATGKDLDEFKTEILKVADATDKSAVDIAKAFQLVGSAQPELLKSATALAEVTKQAVILAKAGGLDVPQAADALTKSMNQFGVGADQAANFIDILANSQQKGTATIDQLAEAMIKGGGTARGMGLDFEQANVLLQAFAKGGVVGSEAGTQMAGALSKLAKVSQKEFNPTQTNAITVIDNLKKAQLSYKDLIKLTDAEGAKWITTLINNNDVLQDLDGGLSKNGSALEQAATRFDTVTGKTEEMGSAYDNMVTGVTDGSGAISDAVKGVLSSFTGLFKNISMFNAEATTTSDKWRMVGNVFIGFANKFTGMITGLLGVVDAVAGTDLAGNLEIEKLGIVSTKVGDMDAALKKYNSTQLAVKKVELQKHYEELGLSAVAAKKHVTGLVTAQKDLEQASIDGAAAAAKAEEERLKASKKSEAEAAAKKNKKAQEKQDKIDEQARAKKEKADEDEIARASKISSELQNVKISQIQDQFAQERALLIKKFKDETALLDKAKTDEAELIKAKAAALTNELEAVSDREILFIAKIVPPTEEELAQLALIKEKAQAAGDAVTSAFSSMGSILVSQMGEAETGMQQFQQSMVGIVTKLIGQALASSIANAIVAGSTTGAASGPAAAFLTPTLIATTVGSVLSAFAAIPAFASGVSNFGGGPALVGELGPELVSLPRHASVTPNNMLGGSTQKIELSGEWKMKGTDMIMTIERTKRQGSFKN